MTDQEEQARLNKIWRMDSKIRSGEYACETLTDGSDVITEAAENGVITTWERKDAKSPWKSVPPLHGNL